MKINDQATLDIAATVMDVVEGKIKKEEAKYPHDMFHPETGEKKVAKTEKDHKELSDKGYTHDKPKNESPEEPRAKGEKDFKALHKVKTSGEKDMDGTVVKESKPELSEEEKYSPCKRRFSQVKSIELDRELLCDFCQIHECNGYCLRSVKVNKHTDTTTTTNVSISSLIFFWFSKLSAQSFFFLGVRFFSIFRILCTIVFFFGVWIPIFVF